VVGVVTLLSTLPACSSPSTPSTISSSTSSTMATSTTAPSVVFPQGLSAEVAACEADGKTVEIAVEAYMAEKGAYPTPPSPWSATTYVGNFSPLTSAGGGGPYLAKPPGTANYVIEYDSSGDVWVAPPGAYGATFNPGQSMANTDVCEPAVR
jgi:hypothetical protein